jgi:GWxTD domain-containing protein
MRFREVGINLVTMVILSGAAVAQPSRPMEQLHHEVFLGGVGFPGSDSLTARLDIVYRMNREFFVPVRVSDSSVTSPYLRSGEILIELFDSTDVSVAREIRQVTLPDHRSEPVPGERFWHEGLVSFSVPPGLYRVFFEATDRQSQRRYLHPRMTVRAPGGGSSPMTLFPVFFISQLAADRMSIDSFGADILFSTPRQLLIAFIPPEDTLTRVSVDYQIGITERDEKPKAILVSDTLASVTLIRGKQLTADRAGDIPQYLLTESAGNRVAYFAVPLKTESLPLRSYLLTVHVTAGSQTATLERRFRNIWPEMPQSLKNPETAFQALRFIVPGRQIDSLMRGDFEERLDNLERFWADKDKTPGTAYNEVMAEYYRRVDHAQKEYATLREPDGTKSDRGRIYVLYGPPTRTERSLQPRGGHRETWIYEHSKRRFTFVDEQRNGTYTLQQSAQ